MFDEGVDLMHGYHHFFQLMKEVKKRLVVERDMEMVGEITGDLGKELDMMTITKVEVMNRADMIRAGMTKEGMPKEGMTRAGIMVVMTTVVALMMVVLMVDLMMGALTGVTLVEIFKQTLASMTCRRSDIFLMMFCSQSQFLLLSFFMP